MWNDGRGDESSARRLRGRLLATERGEALWREHRGVITGAETDLPTEGARRLSVGKRAMHGNSSLNKGLVDSKEAAHTLKPVVHPQRPFSHVKLGEGKRLAVLARVQRRISARQTRDQPLPLTIYTSDVLAKSGPGPVGIECATLDAPGATFLQEAVVWQRALLCVS
ncbi:hypothetical protein NDU88_004661 [Pleurodeles waltl]|uniref:Uncharacterized protein n=1 Tax=Pleurodeles waltl TaxID=8319 RepID=A0AAV7T8E5_PLEWA|nr:hypothetical protein NDU88_004661 [Pleurodeles waltl]